MSEIARLRRQIELECEAMRLALYGYAAVASHNVIEQKYNNLGRHQENLERYVGKEEASSIVKPRHNPGNKYVQYCLQKNLALARFR